MLFTIASVLGFCSVELLKITLKECENCLLSVVHLATMTHIYTIEYTIINVYILLNDRA